MGYASRRNAAERESLPKPRMIFGLTKEQKRAAFVLSYLMAHIDNLKRHAAKGFGGKTGREYVMLDNLEEHSGRMLDFYRLKRFHTTDLEKAAAVFDAMDEKLKEIMG